MRARESYTLLERERELAVIDRFVGSGPVRSGGVLVVVGPAGIGKTRLLDVVADRASARGLAVHVARALDLERDLAWGVVRQLFAPVVRRWCGDGDDTLLSGAARLAGPALGLGGDLGADSLSAALHGLYWLAANLGEQQPVLLAVDDAQWADPASTRYLQYLSKRVADVPVLLAVTVRTSDAAAVQRARALRDVPHADVLEPRPLSVTAAEQIMATGMGRDADREFVEACQRATGGNPFLLTELALQLTADGIAPVATAAPRVSKMTPQAVVRSVLQRLDSLPQEAQTLAQSVAILGDGAQLHHASALAELTARTAADAADALSAAELLRRGAPLHFVHPLVAAAVYGEIPPLARQAAHGRAARLLANTAARPEVVAAQLLQCGATGDRWAVDQLLSAGGSARNRGAPEEAISYLRRALDEQPQGDRRAAVLAALGTLEAELHGPQQALDHLRAGCAVARDPGRRTAITLALVGALVIAEGHREAFQRARATLTSLRGTNHELELQLEAAMIASRWYVSGFRADQSSWVPRSADGLAGETLGEKIMLVSLAAERVFSATEPAAVAVELIQRALARGSLVQDLGPQFITFWQAMYLLHAADALDLSEHHEREALEVARRRGSATALCMAATYRAHLYLQRGLLRDAEAEIDQAQRLKPPWPFFRLIIAHVAIETLIERGRLAQAEAVANGLGEFSDAPLSLNDLFPLCSRGRLRIAQRRPNDALADLRRVGRETPTHNPAIYAWRSRAATALLAVGRRREGRALIEEELELARAFNVARPVGVALRAMAVLAGPREGVELLRESTDVLDACPSRLERARSELELGSALRRSGKRAEAVALLRRALDAAEASAATPLAERARRELMDADARPHRPARLGRDELTPSELRVARLAAEGHSNKDIAQALFVSLRTVETHLTHAYLKLGIGARTELGGVLTANATLDTATSCSPGS